MPGLDWDLNLTPERQPQALAGRRLDFDDAGSPSPSSSGRVRSNVNSSSWRPTLGRINENPNEATPSSSGGTTGALHPAPGGATATAVGAPVTTSLALPPGLSQSQQAQEAVASARMLEQLRQAEAWALFGDYQRQQALAAEAALHLAWASAARLRSPEPMLYTLDGGAAGYETQWEELHPVSQGLLLQIEDKIREYRVDSARLDQCSHLADLSLCNKRFGFHATQITQEAESFSIIMKRENASIESLMTVIKEIIWSTNFAICSYVKLRPRSVHTSAGSANSVFSNHSESSGAQTGSSQLLAMSPGFHRYSSATRWPSPFVQHTVARFEDHLGECCKLILELEQLVQKRNDKTFAESLESLSKVMSNVHDYLIQVASKVEHIHQYVETMKTKYLNDRRRGGDLSNPFLKANRREAAKQAAAARIIHPTLHLSPDSPTGQPMVAVPMIASQLQQTSFPTVAASPSSYPALPLPSVLPPSSIQTSRAPLTNPFSPSGSVLQSTSFGSFSTVALGNTPATSLPGNSIPSSSTTLVPISSGG